MVRILTSVRHAVNIPPYSEDRADSLGLDYILMRLAALEFLL